MRVFIAICLLGTAFASPQGYNYQQQQNTFSIGVPKNIGIPAPTHTAHAAPVSNTITHEGQSFLQEALQNTKLMQMLLGGPTSFAPQIQSFYQAPQQQQQQQQQSTFGFNAQPQTYQQQAAPVQSYAAPQQHYQQANHHQHQHQQQQQQYQQQNYNPAPVVTKDIYVHVAPEEPEEKYAPPPPAPVAPPRKHYRIVFIKAPTPSVRGGAIRFNQAPTEEKTIIYVLTKKPDPLDLQAAFQEVAPKQPSKPEVYFIKYKTQEEAAHAQRTIQAQYDQLGGTTQISDEGVAPVTSVIGALDNNQQNGGAGFPSGAGASGSGIGISTGSGSGSDSSSLTTGSGNLDIRSGGIDSSSNFGSNGFGISAGGSSSSYNSAGGASSSFSSNTNSNSNSNNYLPPIKIL